MPMLRIKQGKFYDEKWNLVPIEHGNKDQIKLIDKVKEFQNPGIEPIAVETTQVSGCFKCLCGTQVSFEFTIDPFNEKEFIDEDCNCSECGQKFSIYCHDDYGYMVKLNMK